MGYRKKPLWIKFTACLLIATPFLQFLWLVRSTGAPDWYTPETLLRWIPHLGLLPFLVGVSLIVAGVALFYVKKWSWWIAMSALCLLSIHNLRMIQVYFPDDTTTLIVASILCIGLLALIMYSDFRKPFMNARLRWWESRSRYRVNLPVELEGYDPSVLLVDISRSGLLIHKTPDFQEALPQETIVHINDELNFPCSLSRKTDEGAAYKILRVTKHQSRYLRNWIKLLSKEPGRKVR